MAEAERQLGEVPAIQGEVAIGGKVLLKGEVALKVEAGLFEQS